MNARPILFSGEMVRALLDGRKTQDRRIVRPQPPEGTDALRDIPGENHWWAAYATHDANGVTYRPLGSDQQHSWRCPYGRPGDLLWVREAFMVEPHPADLGLTREMIPATWDAAVEAAGKVRYRADVGSLITGDGRPWMPSIYMPRWASRITLRLTDVRVERLQDISGADAIAEGIECGDGAWHTDESGAAYRRDEYGWFVPGQHRRHNSPIHAYRDLWESINGPGSWDANPWVWALTFDVIPRNVDAVLKEAA